MKGLEGRKTLGTERRLAEEDARLEEARKAAEAISQSKREAEEARRVKILAAEEVRNAAEAVSRSKREAEEARRMKQEEDRAKAEAEKAKAAREKAEAAREQAEAARAKQAAQAAAEAKAKKEAAAKARANQGWWRERTTSFPSENSQSRPFSAEATFKRFRTKGAKRSC